MRESGLLGDLRLGSILNSTVLLCRQRSGPIRPVSGPGAAEVIWRPGGPLFAIPPDGMPGDIKEDF